MNTILKNSFVKENDLPWKGEEEPSVTVLRILSGWNSLVESRIQKAMAAGEFKNLPYHGSAPAWIEMQAELDKEIQNFRKHVREIWLKYAKINKLAPNKADSAWEQSNFNFFQVSIKTLNNRLRSYNTIAPYSVRRIYLTVEGELNKMYHDMKNINSNSDDNDEDDGKIKHLDKYN
ncbi:11333_t:CDS:2 [Entrophospora sp. SA101]|nr:11333_t:CDS:2 [Entrophospora sp. SA101]